MAVELLTSDQPMISSFKSSLLKAALLYFFLGACHDAFSQEKVDHSWASPQLRTFLRENTSADKFLMRLYASLSTNRTVRILYFYTDDESKTRPYHYYPDRSTIEIVACHNQEPIDQYLSIAFELLNSENENRFRSLWQHAEAGTIEKRAFALSILKIESEAMLKLKSFVQLSRWNDTDLQRSKMYPAIKAWPSDFDAYVAQQTPKTVENIIQLYGEAYDKWRQLGAQNSTNKANSQSVGREKK